MQSLAPASKVDSSQEVAAEPSIASMDLCRLEAKHEPEKLAKTVMQRGKMSAVEIAIYLTSEMKRLVSYVNGAVLWVVGLLLCVMLNIEVDMPCYNLEEKRLLPCI